MRSVTRHARGMLAQELVTMSAKEVDRLEIIRRVLERRLKRVKAAQVLGITARQVRRLCDAYEREGAAALVSKRRGQPSNHRLSEEFQRRAVALVRDLYGDFGPTLAREKLIELHGIRVAKETLREGAPALEGAGKPRRARPPTVSQPARITLASVDPNGPVQAFFDRFAAEQAERHRRYSVPGNQRKRERELAAAATRPRTSETT